VLSADYGTPPARARAGGQGKGWRIGQGLARPILTAAAPLCYAGSTKEGIAVHDLKSLIRTIPDYPKKGILFRDVTTLLGDGQGFRAAISAMAAPFSAARPDAVAGIEARGFILGGAIADRLGCGFVPLRKKGKLPAKTIGQEYTLEYGVDIIEMHEDAVGRGARVLIVDDLIATGGTAEAAAKLLRRSGGEIVGATFIIELPDLGGAAKLSALGIPWHALMAFAGH
jgi:adenine phosphoribosyltransferase